MSKQLTPEDLAKSGTEHGHQAALFYWASLNKDKYPQLNWLFAVPNGGLRSAATAGKLKAEGVKSGVPDIMLAIPIGSHHGLFIEMKVGKNTATDGQSEWLRFLYQSDYATGICYSWIEARDFILKYLKNGVHKNVK